MRNSLVKAFVERKYYECTFMSTKSRTLLTKKFTSMQQRKKKIHKSASQIKARKWTAKAGAIKKTNGAECMQTCTFLWFDCKLAQKKLANAALERFCLSLSLIGFCPEACFHFANDLSFVHLTWNVKKFFCAVFLF